LIILIAIIHLVKDPLEREKLKYSIDKCSLTATMMHERGDDDRIDNDNIACAQSDLLVDSAVLQVMEGKMKGPITKKKGSASLSSYIQGELKSLQKLASKSRFVQIESILNEWEDDGKITVDQRVYIEDLVLNK
jgi:hypothetical protein